MGSSLQGATRKFDVVLLYRHTVQCDVISLFVHCFTRIQVVYKIFG